MNVRYDKLNTEAKLSRLAWSRDPKDYFEFVFHACDAVFDVGIRDRWLANKMTAGDYQDLVDWFDWCDRSTKATHPQKRF